MKKILSNQYGFTLVELLIVIIILSILAAISIPSYILYRERAKESATEAEMRSIANSLEIYSADNTRYPYTDEGLIELKDGNFKNIHLSDKWGNFYGYISNGKTYTLRSNGIDGVGGNSDDIVISNGIMTSFGSYYNKSQNSGSKTSLGDNFKEISEGMINLIENYYEEYNSFPRSWGEYRYTDIGLNPEEWENAYNNIYYKPTGNRLQIIPEEGYKFIVDDIYGNQKELSYALNWNLIYSIENELWYYHTISEGSEINIDSLEVEKDS